MFESLPAVVELFGHQKIAGRVSEVQIGSAAMIRVDVPEIDDQKPFTKFYGTGAIYAITPCDEATMLQAVRALRIVPIERWQLQVSTRPALESGEGDDEYDY